MSTRAIRTVVWLVAMGVLLSPLWSTNAAAGWVVTRASSSAVCNVQDETSRPLQGNIVGKPYSTKKLACDAAKKLSGSECLSYMTGAINLCKAEGVPLN